MGWPSVAWGLARISSRELSEWMAYARVEPFGDEREDLRFAMLMALTANIHRDPKKQKAAFEPKDFMPRFGLPEEEKTQTWQQQLQFVEMLNEAFHGADLRPPEKKGITDGNLSNPDGQSSR